LAQQCKKRLNSQLASLDLDALAFRRSRFSYTTGDLMSTKSNHLNLLTLAALVLASVVGMISTQTPASASRAIAPQAELDKEALHSRMRELQGNIEILLKQYGQSKSQDVRAQIDAAQQEFDSISNQLGGDRPVATAANHQQAQSLAIAGQASIGIVPATACPTTTTTFSASPNIRIPASGTSGTRSTTITVSGIDASIWDVNAITNITHTACADLDITLKSPAGTIVTLTTDNGGTLDNVFNGTLWDDQANPGGQVPYSSNNGLVTDHAYVNNTLASPLVPEEGLAAFIGEDPNGTWTLTISDDASGDIGNLASWSLIITTSGGNAPTTQTVFPSTDPNLPAVISNSCLTGPVISTVNVSGMGPFIGRVRLTADITHSNPPDMQITLTSPHGTTVTISTDNGNLLAPNAFSGTTFDARANLGGQVPYPNCLIFFPCNQGLVTDRVYALAGQAPSLVPEESLAAFNGENPNGVWTLKIIDGSCNLLIGLIKSWSLDITNVGCCSIVCPANISGVTSRPCDTAGVVTYASPTLNDCSGSTTVSCSPASGSTFPLGTSTVICNTMDSSGRPFVVKTCSFTVTVFDVRVQDDNNPSTVILFNSFTGDYKFCCGGTTFTGTGTIVKRACLTTLTHNTQTTRITASVDPSANKGNASVQSPPGVVKGTAADRDIRNNTTICP
jgi:subtilisin-like proprotein convertase family protein